MNKKFLLKTWLLLALMVLGVSSAWADEEVYKTALFGGSYNSRGVSSYEDSWSATNGDFVVNLTNFNNNNNNSNWNYVKCGRKNYASTATIITDAAIDQAITKVVVTIDALTASNVNSIKLYTSSNNSTWTEAGSFTKATGAQEVSLSTPAVDLYYKLEFVCASGSSNGLVTVSKVEYYYNNASAISAVATIGDLGVEVLDFGAEGTFKPMITPADGVTADDYTVTITSSDDNVLYVDNAGSYLAGDEEGQVTITVTVTPADPTAYEAVSKTFTVKIKDPNAHSGLTQADPFTVEEAIKAIENNDYDSNKTYFVKGIISQVDSYNSTYSSITYWISDDGTTNNQFECYSGKGLNGDGFSAKEDLTTGIAVIVKGNMKKYNSTYEFNYDNEIVWMHTPEDIATINGITPTTVNVKDMGDFTLNIDYADGTTPSDYTVTITSSDDNVLTVDNAGSYLAGDEEGQVTITVTVTPKDNTAYKAVSKTFEITIADSREDAGLAWSETTLNVAKGANDYTLPTLTNPYSLPVTYESSDDNIASVDDDKIILETANEGEVTITANFAGDNVYKPAHVSYTITIYNPNPKGTLYNPYTVAEVIGGTATGTGIYVKGFIVGEYVGSTTAPKTSDFSTDANIAIADAFTTNPTASASIPVQLGTTALKNTWGCKTTSGSLIGHEVIIKGNVETYFSVNGIKSTTEVSNVTKSVTVTDALYATLCADKALDFNGLKVKAYMAAMVGNVVTFTPVTKVPAGAGVLLKADKEGEYEVPVTASADELTGNILVGVTETYNVPQALESGYSYYVLRNQNNNVGFYKITAGSYQFKKGTAYLKVKVAGSNAKTFIGLDGTETAVEAVAAQEQFAGELYNLQGQRVGNDYKGIVIVNGKKVIR